ncbi:aminotransferase class III-fold pyridoxal phosphate-dependent enzyme [Actinoplanes oblitus]|uniref:alanine--glyoxylate transaminase n=1 Tax=Actinoplanes oblitus TaxID=3040509 RepID=A0ABY8WA19_9ACTN|nr:aminotransferase class III-fold pyridoxal phosphate-dependent enzyme [Actinoplanes oblitus]WIM94523.1 aminotransferase class III-fold pyridoxal phosphate-dependent enzyme [Actinoplanes oblitus]
MSAPTLAARQRAALPGWVTTYYDDPLTIQRGEGRHVIDADGRRYLDFFGGILTTSVGYDVPAISAAVRAQLDTGVVHTSTLYLIESQVRLAERVIRLAGLPDSVACFVNSGSEANETALLAALCRNGSNHVVTLADGYHGRTIATGAVSSLPGWQPTPHGPFRVTVAANGRPGPDGRVPAVGDCVADLERRLDQAGGPVAALIVEPVQGLAGFHAPPPGLLHRYQQVVAARGGVLICDEVQTGWGRTGRHWWGYEAHGVVPDAVTFAKGLGNGFAIGGVVGSRSLLDSLAGRSISTFGGNPLATTAALATVDHLLERDLRRCAGEMGARLLDGLRVLARSHDMVGAVRGHGLMLAVEITDPVTGRPDAASARRVLAAARDAGLLVGLGGAAGNVLRLAPPMTVTAEEADTAIGLLDAALNAAGTRVPFASHAVPAGA